MLRVAVCGTILTLACNSLWAQAPSSKRRIAVMNFDYSTVHSNVAAIFGTNTDVGKGIADLLVDRFVKGGVYDIYERKSLDKLIAEQNFSNSNRADPTSAVKIGKMLGVDAMIVGSITQFGRDDKSADVSGGALGRVTGRYGIGGVNRRSAKAVVQVSARIVDVETGRVLATASQNGESTRSGTSLLGAGGTAGGAAAAATDMSSKNFGATILGEAVNKAVDGLAAQFEKSSSQIPVHVAAIDGLVADVNGNTLVLNIGARKGVKVGAKLQVSRTGREIRDPATGAVIRRTDSQLGEIVITEVDDLSSVGTYTGQPGVKVGDRVKTP